MDTQNSRIWKDINFRRPITFWYPFVKYPRCVGVMSLFPWWWNFRDGQVETLKLFNQFVFFVNFLTIFGTDVYPLHIGTDIFSSKKMKKSSTLQAGKIKLVRVSQHWSHLVEYWKHRVAKTLVHSGKIIWVRFYEGTPNKPSPNPLWTSENRQGPTNTYGHFEGCPQKIVHCWGWCHIRS